MGRKLIYILKSLLLLIGVILMHTNLPVYAEKGSGKSDAWGKSSLVSIGQGGTCVELFAYIKNGGSGDMRGTVNYEVYFSTSGNPKNGSIIGSGQVGPLVSGVTATINHVPKIGGIFMFKVYQEEGHPGIGELWSEQIVIEECSDPVDPVDPTDPTDPVDPVDPTDPV
ncbi:TasA anchoring/assembly protein, partial [Litchfieldia salsa]